MRRFFHATILALVFLAAVMCPALAQNQVQSRPTPGSLPPAQTQAVARPTSATTTAAPVYVPTPAYGYPGYPPRTTRAEGYLNGVSNVVSAYGQYRIDVNQAPPTHP